MAIEKNSVSCINSLMHNPLWSREFLYFAIVSGKLKINSSILGWKDQKWASLLKSWDSKIGCTSRINSYVKKTFCMVIAV